MAFEQITTKWKTSFLFVNHSTNAEHHCEHWTDIVEGEREKERKREGERNIHLVREENDPVQKAYASFPLSLIYVYDTCGIEW